MTGRESQSDELIFGHSKIESSARYLGIGVDDAIEFAKKIDIWRIAAMPRSADMVADGQIVADLRSHQVC